ncbi:unnamed protein product [Onchocerca flexuosa]|uniref:Uncharacterized protein n=1 Tax=Onchocerca flexuosa TaxID=387005 RepID=A0A183I7Y3_9BILA|nr:unnamed protein product [Onchocerca flexuosa]
MLDRLMILLKNPGMKPHICQRCKQLSGCTQVTWMCPHCNTYSSDISLPKKSTASGVSGSSNSNVKR